MNTVIKDNIFIFEERKSKFIAHIKKVNSVKEAEDYINKIKNEHSEATHNCSCYRLFEEKREYFRFDDDGEPLGTAGKPMLDVLGYMEVANVCVVATRYFGGIKLGASGLIRAYAKCAKDGIRDAGITELIEEKILTLELDYDKYAELEKFIIKYDGKILEKNFDTKIFIKIKIIASCVDELLSMKNIKLLY